MERVASLSNPSGFFDPKTPAGEATPPERDPNLPPPDPDAPPDPRYANLLAFGNSDMAFAGNHLFMGSFHGFNTFDVESGRNPKLLGSVVCPGGQGDMSVHGNLLFMSVEQTRGRLDCGTGGVQEKVSTERFRGIRIFDISDLKKPRQVAAIQTCRGSHTHTLVPDPNDKTNIYVYGSGTSSVRSAEELAGCSGLKPDEDPNTALFSIDVIKVSLAHPETAAHRQPSAHFRRPEDRRDFRVCGPAAITAPARRKPRRPTSATTSPSFRRWGSRPAPAPATESSSTSTIPCTRFAWTM